MVFLIWSSGSHFVQRSVTICAILVEYYEEQFCEIILNWGQWFRRCRLKDFLSGALQPSCSVEQNNLCNFETGHHEGLDGGGGCLVFTKNLAYFSSL